MGLSMGAVDLKARRIAKEGMEHMLKDLAKGIGERSLRIASHDGGIALEIVAEEIEKIDPGDYFGRTFP